jgi:hypothetical protein
MGLVLVVAGLMRQPQLARQIADQCNIGGVHFLHFFEALEPRLIRPQRQPKPAQRRRDLVRLGRRLH